MKKLLKMIRKSLSHNLLSLVKHHFWGSIKENRIVGHVCPNIAISNIPLHTSTCYVSDILYHGRHISTVKTISTNVCQLCIISMHFLHLMRFITIDRKLFLIRQKLAPMYIFYKKFHNLNTSWIWFIYYTFRSGSYIFYMYVLLLKFLKSNAYIVDVCQKK